VVLIGDAAHAMTPNLGRGACEALVDAVTLAELLNALPVEEALRSYDRRRRLRTQALGLASSALMRVALTETAQPLRDRLLSLARRPKAGGTVATGSPS
jgi:2-polyprenyl-6-methoxyphenol hydroxylase-like FAD-dependent oxidoreductase